MMKPVDAAIIWYGELTTRGRLLKRGTLLLMPGILWLMLFLVLPGLVLVVGSAAGASSLRRIWLIPLIRR